MLASPEADGSADPKAAPSTDAQTVGETDAQNAATEEKTEDPAEAPTSAPAMAQMVDGVLIMPTTAPDTPPSRLDVEATAGLEVSLEDAVVYALRHNLQLVIERFVRERSMLGIVEAYGRYDLVLEADASTGSLTRPPASVLEELETAVFTRDDDTLNLALSQLTPWGGTVSLGLDNTRSESSDLNRQPNPSFDVGAELTFLQPLMRNFGRLATERDILVARATSGIDLETFRDRIEATVELVADFYWDLVEARAQLDVAEESLDLAKELDEMNRIQVEVGTLAPLELVQSEVGVATREEDIIRFQAAVGDFEDQLRRLINLDAGVLWDLPVVPVSDPEIERLTIVPLEAIETAIERRVDVAQQRLDNEIRRITLEFERNQSKPQLDLTARYGYNGLAGDVEVSDPELGVLRSESDYADALEQIIDREFEGWSIGLQLRYPLQNRAARARQARAELALEQGDLELRDLEDLIRVDVRSAIRGVETAAKAIDSARVSSRLAVRNLEAEQKRYENGLSTSFQVLEIQEDLSEARSREISAVIAYRKALVDFERATGTLLDTFKIELSTPTDEPRVDLGWGPFVPK